MNCEKAQEQIDQFRENSLSEKAESALREHLADCRKCRQMLTGLDALDQDLKALFEQSGPSANLVAKVSEAVADEKTGRRQSIHLVWLKPALAASLVAGLGILWLRNYEPSTPSPADPMLASLQEFEPPTDSLYGVGEPFVIGEDSVAAYTGKSKVRVIRSSRGPHTLIVDAFPEGFDEMEEG